MSWGAVASGAISVGGSLLAGRGGGRSVAPPAYESIDVNELDELIRGMSRRNIEEGMATERQYRPEFAGMRSDVDRIMAERLLGSQARQGDMDQVYQSVLSDLLGEQGMLEVPELERSQLFDSAVGRAQEDLDLGGLLPREIQNMVTRAALARGGEGRAGTQMGRDIVARDLGLTGMGLRDQRLGTAAQLGQVEQQTNVGQQAFRDSIARANQQLLGQRRAERASGLNWLEDLGARDRQMATAATLQTALPQIGMDPGSMADVIMSDRQAAAAHGQQGAALQAQQNAARQQQRQGMWQGVAGGLGQAAGAFDWSNMFGGGGANTSFSSSPAATTRFTGADSGLSSAFLRP